MGKFATPRPVTPIADRLWPKVNKNGPFGCWLWTGAIGGFGYGHIGRGRRDEGLAVTHRVAYELIKGPIPDGLVLDHLCRVPACCNPDHLEPVTPTENARRGFWAQLMHCPHGHPYDEDNTHVLKNGGRMCRTCHRDRERRRRLRLRLAKAGVT